MAKRKCTRWGRAHGRRVCRKFSGSSRCKKAGPAKASYTPGVAKAITQMGKKACTNPVRDLKSRAIIYYLRAEADSVISHGVPAIGKGAAKRRLRGIERQLETIIRKNKKCVQAPP